MHYFWLFSVALRLNKKQWSRIFIAQDMDNDDDNSTSVKCFSIWFLALGSKKKFVGSSWSAEQIHWTQLSNKKWGWLEEVA